MKIFKTTLKAFAYLIIWIAEQIIKLIQQNSHICEK